MGKIKTLKRSHIGAILIILAGIFWGIMGIFVRRLTAMGFSSTQITALRLSIAAIVFAGIMAVKDPRGFRIHLKDVPLFLAIGLTSVMAMSALYFTAIQRLELSTAAVLLYTSPIWVVLIASVVFKEKITVRKAAALAAAFAGCVLVSGFGSVDDAWGLVIGVAAGITYGLYSIYGPILLKKYSAFTVTTYAFAIAAIGTWCICNPAQMIETMRQNTDKCSLAGWIVSTGVVTAVFPFLLYTMGLERVEAGKAAILATTEPAVAFIVGAIAYGEKITLASAAGILCIFAAVILLNYSSKRKTEG